MEWTGGDVSVAQLSKVVSQGNLEILLHTAEQLRRRHVAGSRQVAEATAKTLRSVVATSKFWDAERLLLIIRLSGRFLQQAQPGEPIVGNVTLRILSLLREELIGLDTPTPLTSSRPTESAANAFTMRGLLAKPSRPAPAAEGLPTSTPLNSDGPRKEAPQTPHQELDKPDYGTLGSKFLIDPAQTSDPEDSEAELDREDGHLGRPGASTGLAHQVKPILADLIQELLDELETSNAHINKLGRQQVHSGEMILTLGRSSSVEGFLKAAAKERTFTVIVMDGAPGLWGHTTAANLAKAGINTLLVPDASIYAWLPKVTKVVIGAHFVLANGGVVVEAGARLLASAAKVHSVPFTVVTGTYKVCPNWERAFPSRGPADRANDPQQNHARSAGGPLPYVPAALELSYPPGQAFPLDDKVTCRALEDLEIIAPMYDYVPPHMIHALFTNTGGFPTSHVSRVVREQYVEEDVRALA